MKEKLCEKIIVSEDLVESQYLNREELLTFLFSAKESLYKTLYPNVLKFFGFDHAAVVEITEDEFTIILLKNLNSDYRAGKRFRGQYLIIESHLLTLITTS